LAKALRAPEARPAEVPLSAEPQSSVERQFLAARQLALWVEAQRGEPVQTRTPMAPSAVC